MWGYILIILNVGVNRNSEGVVETYEEPLRSSSIPRKTGLAKKMMLLAGRHNYEDAGKL
jgi:hypothetical protein